MTSDHLGLATARTTGLIVGLVLLAGAAAATSIDTTPRPAILLRDGRFVAQDTSTSMALYDPAGKQLARFPSGPLSTFAVTADGARVLVACGDGRLTLGDLTAGTTAWNRPAARTGLGYANDACFSRNGLYFVVADYADRAAVFDTASGKQVGAAAFPPGQTNVMSAALTPDGSAGVLIELGGRVYTFDVATGAMHDTGLTGAWPVRYSADGRFFAFRSNNSGTRERLRVADAANPTTYADMGQFVHIGHVRPLPDGTFAVTATARSTAADTRDSGGWTPDVVVGVVVRPDGGQVREVWQARHREVAHRRDDFDPVRMVGVGTDYRYVTRVLDLAGPNGPAVRLTVDNSANYVPTVVSYSVVGGRGGLLRWALRCLVLAGPLLVAGLAIVLVVRARRRRLAVRGFPIEPTQVAPPAGADRERR